MTTTSEVSVGERLTMIGTVHVDRSSVRSVEDVIRRLRPEVVALEIDRARLSALQNPGAARASLGPGLSFISMVLLEKFAGSLTGSSPGEEMLAAVRAAGEAGSRVELVDLPISFTIDGLKKLPWRERLRLVADSAVSLVMLPFGGPDLSSVGENLEAQLSVFRARYPGLSGLLLDKREDYMFKRVLGILESTPGRVVLVVGLGHVASLRRRLADYANKPAFSTTVSWKITTVG